MASSLRLQQSVQKLIDKVDLDELARQMEVADEFTRAFALHDQKSFVLAFERATSLMRQTQGALRDVASELAKTSLSRFAWVASSDEELATARQMMRSWLKVRPGDVPVTLMLLDFTDHPGTPAGEVPVFNLRTGMVRKASHVVEARLHHIDAILPLYRLVEPEYVHEDLCVLWEELPRLEWAILPETLHVMETLQQLLELTYRVLRTESACKLFEQKVQEINEGIRQFDLRIGLNPDLIVPKRTKRTISNQEMALLQAIDVGWIIDLIEDSRLVGQILKWSQAKKWKKVYQKLYPFEPWENRPLATVFRHFLNNAFEKLTNIPVLTHHREGVANIRRYLEEWAQVSPESTLPLDRKARLLTREGRHAEALELMQGALKRSPRSLDLLMGTALLSYIVGNLAQTAQLVDRAWRHLPKMEWSFAPSYPTLQETYDALIAMTAALMVEVLGERDEARELLKDGIAIIGNAPMCDNQLRAIYRGV